MKNNRFKNGIFDNHEWTTDVYDTPKRILKAFNSLNVCGKRIVGINAIGASDLEEWKIALTARSIQRDAGNTYFIGAGGKLILMR